MTTSPACVSGAADGPRTDAVPRRTVRARLAGALRGPYALIRRRRALVIPIVVLLGFVCLGVFGPAIAPYAPMETNLSLRRLPPSWMSGEDHGRLLGTDQLGRDVLSRIIYGARISLASAVAGIGLAGLLGTMLGLVAGFYGGAVDAAIMRVADFTLAVHVYLLAIVLAVAWGPGMKNVVLVATFLLWSRYARQARAEALALKHRDFVVAAQAVGCAGPRIMLRHVLPNIVNSLIVLSTLQVGFVIVFEATLSFLGAGVPPPNPSWGVMVADGRALVASAWWISTFPGLAILLVVLSVNVVGDAARDALDPRLRRTM